MAVVVVCTSCGKRLSIPEALYEKKVRGRVVSITCKVCGNPVKVDGTVPPPASGPKPPGGDIPKSARVPRELVPSASLEEGERPQARPSGGPDPGALDQDWG